MPIPTFNLGGQVDRHFVSLAASWQYPPLVLIFLDNVLYSCLDIAGK